MSKFGIFDKRGVIYLTSKRLLIILSCAIETKYYSLVCSLLSDIASICSRANNQSATVKVKTIEMKL